MILINIYKCDVCKKIRFGDLYIGNSFICGKCYRKMKDEEKAHKSCYEQIIKKDGKKLILLDELKEAYLNGLTEGRKENKKNNTKRK